ncbi:uncharacterized protein CIMG_10630 [Coccidioides immitis RS]|uniref:Uncharacterized protein n=1 Tax=Coccidioides immitis (strain RS) TaxID=246410 RepID=A0A0D8JSD7_COCIM|nr:uncharacterized protein CIMG_10630 [Coccidioides immitis RS]KJF60255.1 hypothetical protein CIMG_10630 [Coccidioides immitis RS]
MGDVQSVGKWLGPQQDVSFCGKFLDMFLPAILCVLHPSSARIPESFSYSQRSVAMLRVRRSLYCSECKGESYACIKTMVTPVGVQSTTSLSTESDFSRQRWLKR